MSIGDATLPGGDVAQSPSVDLGGVAGGDSIPRNGDVSMSLKSGASSIPGQERMMQMQEMLVRTKKHKEMEQKFEEDSDDDEPVRVVSFVDHLEIWCGKDKVTRRHASRQFEQLLHLHSKTDLVTLEQPPTGKMLGRFTDIEIHLSDSLEVPFVVDELD